VRTLAAVAGGPLPGEEAEGAVPRVLELAVRHPRLLLLLLTCRKSQQNPSDPPRAKHGRLASAATKWPPPARKGSRVESGGDYAGGEFVTLTCGGAAAAREGTGGGE